MIVDASAMVAYFSDEPAAERIEEILVEAGSLLMSTVTLAECGIVLARRVGLAPEESRTRIEGFRIEFVPLDSDQAVIAAQARLRFPIRFGDGFVYALAKERGLPILTLDAEFSKTDADLVPLSSAS